MALTVKPARARPGKRTRFRVTVTYGGRPLERVSVRIRKVRQVTGAAGTATLTVTFDRKGRAAVAARKGGFQSARVYVKVGASPGSSRNRRPLVQTR